MKYKVTGISIKHNGEIYAPGADVDLNEKDAKRLEKFLEKKKTETAEPENEDAKKNLKTGGKK